MIAPLIDELAAEYGGKIKAVRGAHARTRATLGLRGLCPLPLCWPAGRRAYVRHAGACRAAARGRDAARAATRGAVAPAPRRRRALPEREPYPKPTRARGGQRLAGRSGHAGAPARRCRTPGVPATHARRAASVSRRAGWQLRPAASWEAGAALAHARAAVVPPAWRAVTPRRCPRPLRAPASVPSPPWRSTPSSTHPPAHALCPTRAPAPAGEAEHG
jgi:hypothetical protein